MRNREIRNEKLKGRNHKLKRLFYETCKVVNIYFYRMLKASEKLTM